MLFSRSNLLSRQSSWKERQDAGPTASPQVGVLSSLGHLADLTCQAWGEMDLEGWRLSQKGKTGVQGPHGFWSRSRIPQSDSCHPSSPWHLIRLCKYSKAGAGKMGGWGECPEMQSLCQEPWVYIAVHGSISYLASLPDVGMTWSPDVICWVRRSCLCSQLLALPPVLPQHSLTWLCDYVVIPLPHSAGFKTLRAIISCVDTWTSSDVWKMNEWMAFPPGSQLI